MIKRTLKNGKPNYFRDIFSVTVIFLAVYWVFFSGDDPTYEEMSYSEFLQMADEGSVSEIELYTRTGKSIVTLEDGRDVFVGIPNDQGLFQRLEAAGVTMNVKPLEEEAGLRSYILAFGPVLLFAALIFFIFAAQRKNGVLSVLKPRFNLRKRGEQGSKITFAEVAGADAAKSELAEIVDFLRQPDRYAKIGARIPKGVLLAGPPGTGKTLLAKAVAGEADATFISMSGSDFVEMFVGVGASRVRALFTEARKSAPAIIFIDEIDAVGRARGAGIGGGTDEREQTLNQLLVEMDGFDARDGIIILAATNRTDVLDPALLRPGRFDRKIHVSLPDLNARRDILAVHTQKTPCGPDLSLIDIARMTPGFSGADLENLVNEAALTAARRRSESVDMHDFEMARDRLLLGAERKSLAMSEADMMLTAYHEAGHATAALMTPSSDKIVKATIIPRGQALGMVVRIPEGDRVSMSKEQLEGDLVVAMAGRAAEEIVYGKSAVTTGAASDIRHVTDIARRMVCEWGMSDEIGMVRYASESSTFPAPVIPVIEREVKRICDTAYADALGLLKKHRLLLERIARELRSKETLSGAELESMRADYLADAEREHATKAFQ